MNPSDRIKLFRLSHEIVERELDAVERTFNIDLGRDSADEQDKDQEYYPQFEEAVRKEARIMGAHYELFYCLEKSIRSLIKSKLNAEHGANWWDTNVPQLIQKDVSENMKREIDSGVTPRSQEKIDYTTCGQLGDIVRHNWQTFIDTFSSEKAFTRIMNNLNVLRGPIAHCSPLVTDEVVRLRLTVKDWFRLME